MPWTHATTPTRPEIEGSDIFIKRWNDHSGNSHPASNTTDTDQPMYMVTL